MRVRSIIAILLISVVAIPALAQDEGPPWEVRPYLSTYTDDAARSGSATMTWNFTATRHRFVCPYCGYSTTVEDADADGNYECPNPFDITHPATQLVEATPRQRVLGYLDSDLIAQDIDGDRSLPLVGRPFHPGRHAFPLELWADPDTTAPWEDPAAPGDVASFLTARVAGDFSQIISADYGLRLLVVDPGSVRAAARARLLDSADATTGDEFYRPAGETGAEAYGIHINPYRVSDGDVWYIRHTETNAGAATTGVEVEVYSTLYGLNFDSEGAINTGQYTAQGGCRVITDDGAVVIDIPRRGVADSTGQWIIKFVIDSNTQTLPRPDEVNYDLWETQGFSDIYAGDDEPQFPDPGWEGTELSDIAAAKEPFVVAADPGANPILATADENDGVLYPVEEKTPSGGDPNFNTQEIWPYRMSPAAAGKGRVMLQWSPRTAGAITAAPMDGQLAYYRTGNEWHYLVDLSAPATALVTNADTAANTPLPADTMFIDSYFMCSRLDVDHDITSAEYLGDDLWMNSLETDRGVVVEDDEAATGGHPRVVLGTEQDPDGAPEAWGGEYAPGTRTPSRRFSVANRTPTRVVHCPVDDDGCGARYPVSEHQPGDICPACGETLTAARGEAHIHYDAQHALTAPIGDPPHRMTPEAVRFGLSGAMVPIGSPDFLQEVFADIPPYQPPSVPATSGDGYFANDIDNDWGYRGTMLAFNRPSDDGDQYDTNTTWDVYYLSPETGEKFVSPDPPNLPIGQGQAEWVCSVCGSSYSRDIPGDECQYCGNDFTTGADLPDPLISWDSLVAEEYDPFGVQVSVLREAAMAAEQGVVDLGWVAPGVAGDDAWPSDVSNRSEMPVRNEGNIGVLSGMRAASLLGTGVDGAVRSYLRRAQTVPITLQTLFRYRPGPAEFGGANWQLLQQDATGAAGEVATALLQAGVRGEATGPYADRIKPVPLGQPLGNYANDMMLFVDINPDAADRGYLEFFSPIHGSTSTQYHAFNPEIDEPYEPVVTLATRARVVESRLPQNDLLSQDLTPTLLYDAGLGNLQSLWVGRRIVSGTPDPVPHNVFYANADLNEDAAVGDPVYRGWLWDAPDATPLTTSDTPTVNNTSPTAYVDENTGDRWAMWRRSMTAQAGASSQLHFATSADEDWTVDPNNYIFGSSGAQGGLTGFVREGAPNAHWQLWQAGPDGREHIRYRWEWDPTAGVIPSDERLMLSNTSAGLRADFFEVEDAVDPAIVHSYRKPAVNPFTYVRQPSVWGEMVENADGVEQFQMDVVYTGHLRSLGNSDICWSRFNFGDPTNADFPFNGAGDNFGKVPFPRVVGTTYRDLVTSPTDARGMPAVRDVDGEVRGYVGEQLESTPRRRSYQGRDIDWLVTREKQDPADEDNPFNFQTKPDWTGWMTDGSKPELRSYEDPMFYVGVVTDDGESQFVYAVEWTRGSYDASTGLYRVLPRFIRMTGGGPGELHAPPDDAGPPVWHPYDDSADSANPDAAGQSVFWRDVGGGAVNAKALLAPSARGQVLGLEDETGTPVDAWAD
ncbi:MAG: hypothetical protein ACOCX2_00365, partial [Armatimonadota bacterium]